MSASRTIQPFHPDWRGPKAPFADHYRQIAYADFPLYGQTPRRRVYGKKDPPTCCFCEETVPSARFSSEAHLIPAGLGNRSLFSSEECDRCNLEAGQGPDQELVNLLQVARVFARGRRRPGESPPKLRAPGARSYILGDPNGALTITVDNDDPSIKFVLGEDNVAAVTVPKPPFKPISALRSMLRSAWMLMEPAQRLQHSYLRAPTSGNVVRPFEYWDCYVAGKVPGRVSLSIWEKQSTIEGAPLIVRLTYANNQLVWCAPELGSASYVPSLLPPVETAPPDHAPPRGLLIQVADDSPEPAGSTTYYIASEKWKKGEAAGHKAPLITQSRPRPELDVTLEVQLESKTLSIGPTKLKLQRYDEGGKRFTVSGGAFAAELLIHSEARRDRGHGEVHLRFANAHVSDVLATLELLDLMAAKGAVARALDLDGGTLFSWTDVCIPTSLLSDIAPVAIWLGAVNSEFGSDIRFPESFTENEEMGLQVLAAAISGRGVAIAPSGFSPQFRFRGPAARQILTAARMGATVSLNYSDCAIDVFGVDIPVGTYSVILERPLLNDRQADRLSSASDDECVVLSLNAERIIFVFDRWRNRNTER